MLLHLHAQPSDLPEMSQDQSCDQRPAGGSQGKFCSSGKGDHDLGQDDPQHDGQGEGEKAHAVRIEQFFLLRLAELLVPHVLGRLKPGPLRRHISLQKLGHQLHEQHHAHHTKGIGDAVPYRGMDGSGSINGCRQSRRAGKRPCHHSHADIGRYAGDLNDPDRRQGADDNDNSTQQDIGSGVDLKISEKLGACDKSHGSHETDQSQFSYQIRHFKSKMPEYQSHQKDSGCSQLYSPDLDTSYQVADNGHQKYDHQCISQYTLLKPGHNSHCFIPSLLFLQPVISRVSHIGEAEAAIHRRSPVLPLSAPPRKPADDPGS